MTITELKREEYAGKPFTMHYPTTGYYDIQPVDDGFQVQYKSFAQTTEMSFTDSFFSDWLEAPIAYGAFENDQLLGYVEGALEEWNNRYRISNICVFESQSRHRGIGSKLMDVILAEAKQSGARMVVLETQTCNENAISFYRKHGFFFIGFDLYAYTNSDPDRHEVRLEMGKML